MARTARTHLHYVHIADDLYAVELRQGQRRWTIGRIAGGTNRAHRGFAGAPQWMGLVIGAACWGARVKTRREATSGILAQHGLMFAEQTGGTVVPVVKQGDLVEYHGSHTWLHGERLQVGWRDSAGRYELLIPETGYAELRQVRRASFTLVA